MEVIIHHLTITPTWIKVVMFLSIPLLLLSILMSLIYSKDYEKSKSENNKLDKLKYWLLSIGTTIIASILLISILILPFFTFREKAKVIKEKNYQLIKNGKIIKIKPNNEFLKPANTEIIYEDDNIIQSKYVCL